MSLRQIIKIFYNAAVNSVEISALKSIREGEKTAEEKLKYGLEKEENRKRKL